MPVTSEANVQNTFSFASAVDERTRKKLYSVWMKERGISCMALSVGFTFLAACLARQWIKERGIIDMRVRAKSGPVYSVVYWHSTLANRLHTLAKRPVTGKITNVPVTFMQQTHVILARLRCRIICALGPTVQPFSLTRTSSILISCSFCGACALTRARYPIFLQVCQMQIGKWSHNNIK